VDKRIRGMGEADGAGDRPAKRVRGSVVGLSSDPLAPRNLYAEMRRGNGHAVVASPNGPIKYINPGHPWLSTKIVAK
jgi:hypothetical protein